MAYISTLLPHMENTTDSKSKIGSDIQRLRGDLGESVIDLSGKAGIARGYWYEVERGEVNVTIETLEAIARALDADVEVRFSPKRRRRAS